MRKESGFIRMREGSAAAKVSHMVVMEGGLS